ncbi:MAG: CopD family protein [Xanthobacteraceae bacterium]
MTEALVISRWIHFAAVFALFGSSLYWFYIGPWPADCRAQPRSFRATILMLRVAALVAAVSGLGWLAASIANMTGGFANAVDLATLKIFFLQTPFGPVAILRLALFAGVVLLASLPQRGRAWFLAILIAAALLLVSQAWLGHAAEGGFSLRGALMIFVYAVHMLASAAWVGGLPPLLLTLIGLWRSEARERSVALLSRYSLMGMCAVTLVLASGVANVAFHAVSPGKLFHSTYGEVLFAKLSLLTGMLLLAYFNRFVALPRLRAYSGSTQLTRLRTSISFELALGVLVVGAAAVLGITPPPH